MKKLNTLFFALIFSGAMLAQTVTSVTPGIGYQGSNMTITFVCTGMNFNSSQFNYSVIFLDSASGGALTNFSSTNTTVVNSTTLTLNITIPSSAYLGPYTLQVMNDNLGNGPTALGKFRIAGPNGINEVGVASFKAYPVPATGILYVEAASGQQLSDISLTSLSGKMVLRQLGSGGSLEALDVHGITGGTYILSVADHTGAVSYQKIAVE